MKKKLGFLQLCSDRRFHHKLMAKFENLTGLSSSEYWLEATAGGACAVHSYKTSDYAYKKGASIMAWSAHGDKCGGFPKVSNGKIKEKLNGLVEKKKKKYPKACHYFIFATNGNIEAKKI